MFPNVDPIPVPAPIWLMKALGLLTLALHFCAVMMMIGSLLMVAWFDATGRSRQDRPRKAAALVLSRRLSVIMTYVINLGIPPLLFAQVLYGRAIYTSSVLIGVSWFSVILLVMAAYFGMYVMTNRMEKDRAAWPLAILVFFIVAGIGQIYAQNMTLMLRPEVWSDMYAKTATGLQAPPKDPTTTPRWLFVMSGGLVFGALWMLIVSNAKHLGDEIRGLFVRSAAGLGAAGGLLQGICAVSVFRAQPSDVQAKLFAQPLYAISAYLYLVATLAVVAVCLLQGARGKSSVLFATISAVLGAVGNIGAVIFRDGIRDITLMNKGFDVWARREVSNWTVIVAFLLLFVAGLGVVYWLLMVMKQATPTPEAQAFDDLPRGNGGVPIPTELQLKAQREVIEQ